MDENHFTKEHNIAISNILSSPAAKIALLINKEYEAVKREIELFSAFIRTHSRDIGHLRFAVKLLVEEVGTKSVLDINRIYNCISNDEQLLLLTSGLNYVNSVELEINNENLSNESEDCLIVFVDQGQHLNIWANGRCIKELDVFNPKSKPRVTTKFSRRAEDYRLILLDHFRQHVKYAQSTEHWHDRPKRILRSVPKKTEYIFHKDLWNWLEDHKENFLVFGEVGKLSPDRTDIELVTTKGKRYILEVKWLGKNQKGTTYSEPRICEGIRQIDQYLVRQPDTIVAALVIYNGRDREEFEKLFSSSTISEPDWCNLREWENLEIPNRGDCLVFYLENKTASSS